MWSNPNDVTLDNGMNLRLDQILWLIKCVGVIFVKNRVIFARNICYEVGGLNVQECTDGVGTVFDPHSIGISFIVEAAASAFGDGESVGFRLARGIRQRRGRDGCCERSSLPSASTSASPKYAVMAFVKSFTIFSSIATRPLVYASGTAGDAVGGDWRRAAEASRAEGLEASGATGSVLKRPATASSSSRSTFRGRKRATPRGHTRRRWAAARSSSCHTLTSCGCPHFVHVKGDVWRAAAESPSAFCFWSALVVVVICTFPAEGSDGELVEVVAVSLTAALASLQPHAPSRE